MEVKMFEILDRATCISAIAIRLGATCEAERYLSSRVGFGKTPKDQAGYVVLVNLSSMKCSYDPFDWEGSPRTMPTAHQYIIDKWNELKTGAVVDVEYVLGETAQPKTSEHDGYVACEQSVKAFSS